MLRDYKNIKKSDNIYRDPVKYTPQGKPIMEIKYMNEPL